MMEKYRFDDMEEDVLDQLPDIMTPRDVADALCLHVNTVYGLLKSNELTGFKLRHSWRVRRKDLKEFLKRERVC